MRVLILRPEPGASATLAAARALGLDAGAFPLFEVRPQAWEPVPREAVDAVLLGSANALRHAGAALEAYRGLAAYCVGATTAEFAREAGLTVAATGAGGLQSLIGALDPAHRRLLRLAGRERIALDVPPSVTVTVREVYAAHALPMPAGLFEAVQGPALALLHSGEAAARFAILCDDAAIPRHRIHVAAIGPRVSARAGSGWARVESAASPDDAALLALAKQMCQDVD